MMFRVVIPIVAIGFLAGGAHGDDKRKEHVEKLAGTWTCVSGVNDGRPLAEETVQKLHLTLTKEGGYRTERGKQVLFDSTYKIDPDTQPKQINLIGTEGENQGKTAQGNLSPRGRHP